jgi:3-oxoacyl-[acyl-carrier protein] reductase
VKESEHDRVAVVTGVGRVEGIGFAISRRLLGEGWRVLAHSYVGEDLSRSANENDALARRTGRARADAADAAIEALGGVSDRLRSTEADLGEPDAPRRVIDAAREAFGTVDALVVNHAHGSDQSLATVTVEELDRAWAVNARAAVLLAQAFSAARDDDRPDGRIVLLTSGQHLGPMPGELPYVLSKGALHQVTATLADELAERRITVNAVNPGPVDTGWPSAELREQLTPRFPAGRWGAPEDIAPVVAWLLSADSAWVTGQVIDAEGGFRR